MTRMFSILRQSRDRFAAWFDMLAGTRRTRVVIAIAFAAFHLVMFARAGHERLDLPFNSAPGEQPYYSDINAYATIGAVRQPHHWSRLIVSRWDAEHYIGFAVRGLKACPTDNNEGQVTDFKYLECGLGWQPAYGEMGRVVSKVTSIPEDYSLMILSVIATILANFLWTSAPFVKRLGNREALGSLIAFNTFPSAFHLVAPFTEATTFMFALAAFVALANNRWVLSGFLVGAATALRTAAVAYSAAFGLAAVFTAVQRRRAKDAKWWKPLLGIPLCGWSMALQMLILKLTVGDGLAYVRARHAFGDNHDYFRLFSVEFLLKAVTSQHMDGLVLIGCIAIISLTVREVMKSIGPAESIYMIVASVLGIILGAAGLISRGEGTEVAGTWGLNRYMLMCPITFLCAGVLLRKHPITFILWIALCLGIYWHVELCSFVTQGNPEALPVHGPVPVRVAIPIMTADPEIELLLPADDVADPEFSIVIPALNEQLTIGDFIDWCKEGLAKAGVVGEILIVDSSTDRTREIALAKGARVLATPKRGLGRAYIDSLPFIRGKYVLMGDCDCTYDFRELEPFVEKFRGGAEFIMGSRFRGYIEPGAMPPLHRYLGTPVTTWILNVIFSSHFSDIHCGMRGISTDALKRMGLRSQSWEYASEMVLKSVHMKLGPTRCRSASSRIAKAGSATTSARAGSRRGPPRGSTCARCSSTAPTSFSTGRGFVLLVLGLSLVAPLSFGPVTLGPITFSLHWMLLGLTLATLGLQCVYLGVLAQVFFDYSGETTRGWFARFPYTRTVGLAARLFLVGRSCSRLADRVYVLTTPSCSTSGDALNYLGVTGLFLLIAGFMTFTFTLLLHSTAVVVWRR